MHASVVHINTERSPHIGRVEVLRRLRRLPHFAVPLEKALALQDKIKIVVIRQSSQLAFAVQITHQTQRNLDARWSSLVSFEHGLRRRLRRGVPVLQFGRADECENVADCELGLCHRAG